MTWLQITTYDGYHYIFYKGTEVCARGLFRALWMMFRARNPKLEGIVHVYLTATIYAHLLGYK
ncbi:MAG: hypothetical protein D6698_12705 [Gammaproteobacteria bacterium]|nr:MAG: hypothetical protein D6698_12705 [Gammaproteobacteria bacterium]